MGTYIIIDKVSEKDGVYCYKVSPSSLNRNPFFITITASSRKVYFYQDQHCLNLLRDIDFDKDELIKINGLPSGIAAKAAVRAYMASKKGDFPRIFLRSNSTQLLPRVS